MRDGRSPQYRRSRRPLVVTVLVTVFLARPDCAWLAVAKAKARRTNKKPATGAMWLALTYGSDGTRTGDLRRARPERGVWIPQLLAVSRFEVPVEWAFWPRRLPVTVARNGRCPDRCPVIRSVRGRA
jgi:hypothetical protein